MKSEQKNEEKVSKAKENAFQNNMAGLCEANKHL